MKKLIAALLLAGLPFFAPSSQAQSPSGLRADFLLALADLPFAGDFAANLKLMVEDLQNSNPVAPNGWSSKKRGNFQLHVFLNGNAQAVVLAYDGVLPLPESMIDETLQDLLGNTELKDPMFVFSLINGALTTAGLPPDLKKTIALSYFNAPSLSVHTGVQIIGRAIVGGQLGDSIAALGVPGKNFILSVGQNVSVPGIPSEVTGRSASNSDSTSEGDLARAAGRIRQFAQNQKTKHAAKQAAKAAGTTVPKSPPDYFVEFQTAPGTAINPLGMSPVTLTDATIFATSRGTMGYKGNAIFSNLPNKKFVTFFEAPYDAAGALKITNFKFGLAAPTLNLAEFALIASSFSTPKAPGGKGFLNDISKLQTPLSAMAKPLSLFRITNPNPVPEYRFGDPAYPFPPASAFNLMLLGPLAQETLGGRLVKGPYLKVIGNTTVLGRDVGSMGVNFSEHGLFGAVNADFGSLAVGPIKVNAPLNGQVRISIDDKAQTAGLTGKLDVPSIKRDVTFTFGRETISVSSPATCVAPVDISGRLPIVPAVSIGDVAGSFRGFQVDPAKMANCTGEFLKQGLQFAADAAKEAAGLALQLATDPEAAAKAAAALAEKAAVAAAQETVKVAGQAVGVIGNAVSGTATAATGAVGKGVSDAYTGVARGATAFAGAISGLFVAASKTSTCDHRITWLNERGNVPTAERTRFLIDQVYGPLAAAGLQSSYLYADIANRERLRVPAHAGLQAMSAAWNTWARGKNLNLPDFAAYHAANVLLSGTAPAAPPAQPLALAQARPQGLATGSLPDYVALRDTGGATRQAYGIDANTTAIDHIAGWLAVAEKGEGPLDTSGKQWFRCANAYIADLPVKTAANLKTYLPPVNGTTQPYASAMFNSSAEYNQLLAGIRARADAVSAQNNNYANLERDFYILWTQRSAAFVTQLSQKMIADPLAPVRKDFIPDQQGALDAVMARANRVLPTANQLWYKVQNSQAGWDIQAARQRISNLALSIGTRMHTRGLTYKRADEAMNRYFSAVAAYRTAANNMVGLAAVPADAAALINNVTKAYDEVLPVYQDSLKGLSGGKPLALIPQSDFDQIERQVEILEDIVINLTGKLP